MKLNIGTRITHPIYGSGVVLDSWLSKSVLKSQSTENYAVKFDNGGPWDLRSTRRTTLEV
jgi:hypothetical protein